MALREWEYKRMMRMALGAPVIVQVGNEEEARRDEVLRRQAANSYYRRLRDRLWARELCPQCERHLSMCNCPDEGLWGPYDWEEEGDV